MTVRAFVIGTILASTLSGMALFFVVTSLDPGQAGFVGLVTFFLGLFVFVLGVSSLIGFGIRRLVLRHQFSVYAVRISLRQGGFISVYMVVLLLLQLFDVYRWWLSLLVFGLFVFLELVFLSYDRAHHRQPAKS